MSKWTGTEVLKYRPIVMATYGMTCHLCLAKIASADEFSIDHVLPRSEGGSNAIENLRPAHRRCNYQRGKKSVEEFQRIVYDDTAFFYHR